MAINIFRKKSKVINKSLIAEAELLRLQKLERYQFTKSKFINKEIVIPDAASFLSSVTEIFEDEIYKFESPVLKPLIIDCGANIGLSAIYFKQQFPLANVLAFEPDPVLCSAMQKNLAAFGFTDVDCRNEAVSNEDGTTLFTCEGGHSGMITASATGENVVNVKSSRLKDILQQYDQIDFLKIDIEGHESKVIPDIKEELKRVNHLFLEYHSFIGEKQELGNILSIIHSAGLRYYLKESSPKRFPFIQREMFLNIDCLVNIFCYRN